MTSPEVNIGTNSRTVFGPLEAPRAVDQEVCVTVTHNGGVTQEGVALRMRTDGRRLRVITITKNIWGLQFDHYNVHTWDMTGVGQPPSIVARLSYDPLRFHGLNSDVAPRRLCAKVAGPQITIKVWNAQDPEPDWSDPDATRTATLSPEWVYEGQPGFYVGHLGRPGLARYEAMQLSAI